jgi:hypothetical protein
VIGVRRVARIPEVNLRVDDQHGISFPALCAVGE